MKIKELLNSFIFNCTVFKLFAKIILYLKLINTYLQGTTRCYTKFGHFKFEKRTGLPGGHPGASRNHCCVLDGFYNDKNNTLYILDLLAWNNQPMTDGEVS